MGGNARRSRLATHIDVCFACRRRLPIPGGDSVVREIGRVDREFAIRRPIRTMTDRVTVVPYGPAWPRRFDEERRVLAAVFAGSEAVIDCREHGGSGPWGEGRHRHHGRCPSSGCGRRSDSSTRDRGVRTRPGTRKATARPTVLQETGPRLSSRPQRGIPAIQRHQLPASFYAALRRSCSS